MMLKIMRILLLAALLAVGWSPVGMGVQVSRAADENNQYLPMVFNHSSSLAGKIVVNAPYIQVPDVVSERISRMGIFWYGKLNSDSNYTDVRVGYNDTALWVHVATIDKWLAYNESSNGSGLESWDSATLLLDLNGDSKSIKPSSQSYRFVAQVRHWQPSINYQAAYRGNGTQWAQQNIVFESRSGWRGSDLNGGGIDHGWTMTYIIPFSSLGFSTKPADGSVWRISLLTHDRDTQAGPALADQRWPAAQERDNPSSWAWMRFGLPVYSAPEVSNVQTTIIRQGLNGSVVKDTAAGGGFVCGVDNADVWSQWGDRNFGGADKFNIQNQQDVSDWPCFSKYYVTFPMGSIPSGKVVRSAKLVLHEFGGSDPAEANASLIQVLRIGQDWDEYTLTWNNAPYALENDVRTWVDVYNTKPIDWPGDPYEWDVSRFAAHAHEEQVPLRLALYSGDKAMHSGKYFVSSETGDWNAVGRPTLIVEWGDP